MYWINRIKCFAFFSTPHIIIAVIAVGLSYASQPQSVRRDLVQLNWSLQSSQTTAPPNLRFSIGESLLNQIFDANLLHYVFDSFKNKQLPLSGAKIQNMTIAKIRLLKIDSKHKINKVASNRLDDNSTSVLVTRIKDGKIYTVIKGIFILLKGEYGSKPIEFKLENAAALLSLSSTVDEQTNEPILVLNEDTKLYAGKIKIKIKGSSVRQKILSGINVLISKLWKSFSTKINNSLRKQVQKVLKSIPTKVASLFNVKLEKFGLSLPERPLLSLNNMRWQIMQKRLEISVQLKSMPLYSLK